MLQAGATYRLTAFALAHALSDGTAGTVSGAASYDATLTLPEPSRRWVVAAALVCLAALHRLRERRGCRGPA